MASGSLDSFRDVELADLGKRLGDILSEIFRGNRLFPQASAASVPSIPARGAGMEGIVDLWRMIERNSTHLSSPYMLGHMDVAPHPVAALTSALTSALSNNLLFRELSPFASAVEEQLISYFIGRLGFGAEAGGTFVSGGSLANLSALFAATGGFECELPRDQFSIFCPASVHLSITKAAAVLGVPKSNVHKIKCDSGGRQIVSDLRHALSMRKPGDKPIIVGVAGSTIHGSVDPLEELSAVAADHGAWFHVDAIYGAALAFSARHSAMLRGLEAADSAAIGPQKWMYVPRLSAGLIFKRRELFEKRLGTSLPYSLTGFPHRGQWGLQGSRPADAILLWAVLQIIGTDAMGHVVDRCIDRARHFHNMLRSSDTLVPTHIPDLNIQAFKLREPDPTGARTAAIHQHLTRQNKAWFSTSKWADETLFRAVILAPQITDGHLHDALSALSTSISHTGA